MEKPRFTLLITCYNFENYIRETLAGAFAQTYEPLDIIISDDGSKDRSWEIIQQEVAAYKGPHHIILNRNEPNIGFAANLNKAYGLARTDWVLNQSGDDISLPTRVERFAEVIDQNPNLRCLGCWFEAIGNDGKRLPEKDMSHKMNSKTVNSSLIPFVHGGVAAYHMDVFRKFGPMSPKVWNEDVVLPLRARMLGDVGWVDEPLMRYRFHEGNMSGVNSSDKKIGIAKFRHRSLFALTQSLLDLYVAEREFPERFFLYGSIRQRLEDVVYIKWFMSNWVLSPNLRFRLIIDLVTSITHMRAFVAKFFRRLRKDFT